MPIQLRWVENRSASCFHATAALLSGRSLADQALADALAEPARALRIDVETFGVSVDAFMSHLVPLSAQIASNGELAHLVLKKTLGESLAHVRTEVLRGLLTDLEVAHDRALPEFEDELALRREPLISAWKARGPGMLSVVSRLTDETFVAETADAILVHPALGGAGEAHIPYNSVLLEAVLANPVAELPEVVRLGWLLAQLNLELPRYSDGLGIHQVTELGPYAMVPIALAAAEEVELVRLDEMTLGLALETWQAAPAGTLDAAGILWQWWQVYGDSRPPLAAALKALGEMVAGAAQEAHST